MISLAVMVCNISVSSLFLISLRLLIGGADIAGITRHNESAQALYATNCGSQRHNIIICTSYFAFFFFRIASLMKYELVNQFQALSSVWPL